MTMDLRALAQNRIAAFASQVRKFQKDEEGSIIIFSLFMFAMMLMIGGLAVDVMRAEYQRTKIQYTADRCALSASSLTQTLPAEDVVNDCFRKSGLGWLSPTVIVDQALNSKKVTVYLPDPKIKTLFLSINWAKVFGDGAGGTVDYLATPAVATAIDGVETVEISLVLDVSGSMGSTSQSGLRKIEDLQIAAKQFVDALLVDRPHEDTYSISIVPYSIQVSAGDALLSQMNVSDEHNYATCVDFQDADFHTTTIDQGIPLRRAGYIGVRYNAEDKLQADKIPWWMRNCNTTSDREILPITGSINTLKTYIDNLSPQGWTSTEIGIKWGATLLDPSIRSTVDGMVDGGTVDNMFSGLPNDYSEEGVMKVIVAMTDGANTLNYELKDPYRTGLSNVWFLEDSSGNFRYWVYNPDHSGSKKYMYLRYRPNGSRLSRRWKTAPSADSIRLTMAQLWNQGSIYFVADRLQDEAGLDSNAWSSGAYETHWSGEKDTRMDAICTAAKANNILIYTIGFEVSNSNALKLQNCATTAAHFFRVDGVDIADAFAEIAAQLNSLRLTR